MKVEELKPRSAIIISTIDTLAQAAKRLADDDIGALAVVDSQGPRGVFSERDLVRAVADGADPNGTLVCDYMTQAPLTLQTSAELTEAVAMMNELGVRHSRWSLGMAMSWG